MRIGIEIKTRDNVAPPARVSEPVTFGVPFPKGACRTTDAWRLVSDSFGARPAQTRAVDLWIDGSVRWLLVDAQVSTEGSRSARWYLERGEAPGPGLRIEEGGGAINVDTGVARFTIAPGSDFPFRAVRAGTRDCLGAAPSRLNVSDPEGRPQAVAIRTVTVEERAGLRCVIRLDGNVAVGSRTLVCIARLHFYAGLPTVRLVVTLRNSNRAIHKGGFWDLGDPGSILIKDASIVLSLPVTVRSASVSAEPDLPISETPIPVEIYQDSSGGENWRSTNHINRERRVPTTFQGYRLRTGAGESAGLRATPLLLAGELGVTVPLFWQNFPQALEATADQVTWRMFAGQFADLHEIQGGEQKTHEAFVAFGPDGVSSLPLDWCRNRLMPVVDPDWVMSSEAVAFLAPLGDAHAALVAPAIDGPDSFERKREIVDEFGWRHFGELYGDHESIRQKNPPIVSHYNNQYDAAAGFIHQFFRTGDPRWWRLADELRRHVVDVDVYHTTEDKAGYNGGLFWHTYHYGDADTATHRTYPRSAQGKTHGGGPSADHNYTTGLMLHYFLTGEVDSRDTAIGQGRAVVEMDDGRRSPFRWLDRGDTGRAILSATGYFGPGRGPANSLNALLDAHRLSGDALFMRKAEQLLRRVVHPRQDIAALKLDVPELRWFYTMFLQSLGKYLRYKIEREENDAGYAYGRASLLHFAAWMAEHEHPYFDKPERLEFKTETWPAQDIRKSDVFYHAVMHSDGATRTRFAERGEFFRRYSLSTLAGLPTRTLLRPVVVLLSSGFVADWVNGKPGHAAPAPQSKQAFGEPEVFVPQRARAERRAIQLAVAGFVVFVAGVWWLVS